MLRRRDGVRGITFLEECGICGKDGLRPALPEAVDPNCFYWHDWPRIYFCDAKCSRLWHEKEGLCVINLKQGAK